MIKALSGFGGLMIVASLLIANPVFAIGQADQAVVQNQIQKKFVAVENPTLNEIEKEAREGLENTDFDIKFFEAKPSASLDSMRAHFDSLKFERANTMVVYLTPIHNGFATKIERTFFATSGTVSPTQSQSFQLQIGTNEKTVDGVATSIKNEFVAQNRDKTLDKYFVIGFSALFASLVVSSRK